MPTIKCMLHFCLRMSMESSPPAGAAAHSYATASPSLGKTTFEAPTSYRSALPLPYAAPKTALDVIDTLPIKSQVKALQVIALRNARKSALSKRHDSLLSLTVRVSILTPCLRPHWECKRMHAKGSKLFRRAPKQA